MNPLKGYLLSISQLAQYLLAVLRHWTKYLAVSKAWRWYKVNKFSSKNLVLAGGVKGTIWKVICYFYLN